MSTAILVTIGKRRYVVDYEDEDVFDGVPNGPVNENTKYYLNRQHFGAQWLRGYGRVDEMYRSLGGYEVTKVERVDRDRVWGDRA